MICTERKVCMHHVNFLILVAVDKIRNMEHLEHSGTLNNYDNYEKKRVT